MREGGEGRGREEGGKMEGGREGETEKRRERELLLNIGYSRQTASGL